MFNNAMFKNVQEVLDYLKSMRDKDINYLDINNWKTGYSDGLSEAIVALELLETGIK